MKQAIVRLKPNRAFGQSLVELGIALPVLLLILVGAVAFGIGLYQANIASDAIRQPALKKMEMASTPAAVSPGQVMGWVTGEGAKGSMSSGGGAVDSVSFVDANEEVSIVVGTKRYTPPIGGNLVPGFDITVTQGINKNLLLAANNGAQVRPVTPWVPGGSPRTPPWLNPKYMDTMPPRVNILPQCAPTMAGDNLVQILNTDETPRVYISTIPIAFPSPVKLDSLLAIANFFRDECAGSGDGICEQERENLMPNPKPPALSNEVSRVGTMPDDVTITYQTKNPPGGPAVLMEYTVVCGKNKYGAGVHCPDSVKPHYSLNPDIGEGHGRYFDPGGLYKEPPANFVESCGLRKEAECMLEKGYNHAVDLTTDYNAECQAAI